MSEFKKNNKWLIIEMKIRIKTVLLLCLVLLMPFQIIADSLTLSTAISSVANGVNGIGMGLFPVSMTYKHNKSFQLIPAHKKKASFSISTSYSIANSSLDVNYDYLEGTPKWALSYKEANEYTFFVKDSKKNYITYFSPYSYFDISISQPFGVKKNPVTGGDLVTLKVGVYTRIEEALENTALSFSPASSLYSDKIINTFVNSLGNPVAPFTDEYELKAFPWLEGNRKAFNNYLYATASFSFYKTTGFNTYDGASISLGFEYGPSWLANHMNNGTISSNYWKLSGSATEKITLLVEKQNDGKNWLTAHLGHTNTIGYTGGDVVPKFKMPTDRLRGYFTDKIYLNLSLPQFIATDCYAYLETGLTNSIYFGKVANEVSNEHEAVELVSKLTGTFHMRLWGFIRFQYDISYTFNRGISSSHPAWSQNAELRFWVAI